MWCYSPVIANRFFLSSVFRFCFSFVKQFFCWIFFFFGWTKALIQFTIEWNAIRLFHGNLYTLPTVHGARMQSTDRYAMPKIV